MSMLIRIIRLLRALPVVAVVGALVYAVLTQWCGDWPWTEVLAGWRLPVLALALAGALLSLCTLSILRAVSGLVCGVWLAWPMWPYYTSPTEMSPAAPAFTPAVELTLALCHAPPGDTPGDALQRMLSWNADVVLVMDAHDGFYRSAYQRAREHYETHWVSTPVDAPGLWCFTRLPLAKDWSRTRSKAAQLPVCDWTLALPDKSSFRLLAMQLPPPVGRSGDRGAAARRAQALAAVTRVLVESDGAKLLSGDLGVTPFAASFDRLLAAMRGRDSALGHGLAATWKPTILPGLLVDHVLLSDHWRVVRRDLEPVDASGHRAVVLRLGRVR